jgi:hypothetical protein
MPELMVILTAACLAAEHSQWDAELRARTLAVVFDGMRPQHAPAGPGDTAAAGEPGPGDPDLRASCHKVIGTHRVSGQ